MDNLTLKTFDAAAHMRKIRTRQGMQDYLDVKWRVAWLRAEHPEARIVTEQIEGDAEHARFKCTITVRVARDVGRDGGTDLYEVHDAISTGHGSETLQDFPDFYEKAETKAIGRACATLGYGTDAAIDFDDGEPLDGLPASKSERAARREDAAKAEPPKPQPARHDRGIRPSQEHHEPPLPTDVDPNATRTGPLGGPQPSINQMTYLQDVAIQKGSLINDDWEWRQIANLVAVMRAGKPDAVWTGKLVAKDIAEALVALPDVPSTLEVR